MKNTRTQHSVIHTHINEGKNPLTLTTSHHETVERTSKKEEPNLVPEEPVIQPRQMRKDNNKTHTRSPMNDIILYAPSN